MTKKSVNLDKVRSQLKDLDRVAKDRNWVFRINDLDQAIFSPSRVPSGSVLFSIDDEKYLYLDDQSNVTGVFIEYFSTNFLAHETQHKPLLNELKNTKNGTKIPKKDTKNIDNFINELEKKVFSDFEEFSKSIKR